MLEDLILLKKKFDKIDMLGWISSKRDGTTGIGYTFESLIGKEEESFPIPDFGSIEIKTRYKNSKEAITLFNATPDGDFLYPIKRIYDEFGFPSKQNPEYKVFYANISTREKYAGKVHRFRLNVDQKSETIRIFAITPSGEIINTKVSWSFSFLREKLERKLKYLAIIKAECKYIFGKQHFHYNEMHFYSLIGFDQFIKLIENGIIKTTFMIGYYKTGEKIGKMNSHGVGFDISESDIDKLFYKVF